MFRRRSLKVKRHTGYDDGDAYTADFFGKRSRYISDLWYDFEDGDSKTVSLEDGIFEAVEQVLQVR